MTANSNILPEMLAKRCNRAISIVLSLKERECDQFLPKEASSKLRKVILDQFNDLVDFASDMCDSLDTGEVLLNEEYLRVLNEIHDAVIGDPRG